MPNATLDVGGKLTVTDAKGDLTVTVTGRFDAGIGVGTAPRYILKKLKLPLLSRKYLE